MRRTMLKSKIHRAIVTATNLDYEGSLSIDTDLLEASDILPNEQIHVWDVTNGARLVTYAIPGEAGSGTIQVNGGGAHLIKKGDVIIIATFTELKTKDAKKYRPKVIFLNEKNHPVPKADGITSHGSEPSSNGHAEPVKPARSRAKRTAR